MDLCRDQHLMCIIPYGKVKHRRCTYGLMLASFHRNVPGHSEHDSDLRNWLEQAIDNPMKNENEPQERLNDPYSRKQMSQGLL